MNRKTPTAKEAPPRRQRRNAAATREKILKAGTAEFCDKGFSGARTDAIARRAGCNIRMIYHYFGNKRGLYLAALEKVYGDLRAKEEELDLLHLNPVSGMTALVNFTFDYLAEHQEFIGMMTVENIQEGRHLKESKSVPTAALPLVKSIGMLLRRGQKDDVFRKRVDPVQLYISILSLSYVHISNKHTLSITFGERLDDKNWLARRRRHARDVILAYLQPA